MALRTRSQINSLWADAAGGFPSNSPNREITATVLRSFVTDIKDSSIFMNDEFDGNIKIGTTGTLPITPINLASKYSSSSGSGAVLNGIFYMDQTSATTGSIQGVEGYVKTSNATGSVVLSIGTIGNLEHSGAGTLGSARSVQAGGILSGNGTVTEWAALYSQPAAITGSGTITTLYGLYIDSASAGSGTITNRYGIYVSDSLASNFIAGDLVLGTKVANSSRINSNVSSSSSSGAVLNSVFYSIQTAATTGSIQGVEGYAKTTNATGSVVLSIATIGNLEHSGAGTLTIGRCVQAGGIVSGNGTVTEWISFYAQPVAITGSGTVTTAYGLYVDTASAGSGTITNRYGVYVADANADNFFAGNTYAASGTTGMTKGFFYIPAAAGVPSGTPTSISGRVPMYYDTTNNNFYIYNGSWKTTNPFV